VLWTAYHCPGCLLGKQSSHCGHTKKKKSKRATDVQQFHINYLFIYLFIICIGGERKLVTNHGPADLACGTE
jgi:hypothetical protein